MTERQSQVLKFIERYRASAGYSPTVREIGAHFDIQVHAAYQHVRALVRDGHLQCTPGENRSLVPVKTLGKWELPYKGKVK